MSILDTTKYKFRFRGIDENPLAIVTLNINDEVEVRFCPILWKASRTELFFTMPSLKGFKYQNSFVILDEEKYKILQSRVLAEFLEQAREHYHPNEFRMIEQALGISTYSVDQNTDEKINDIAPEDIPF